ncbi:hypothetical protein C0993_000974 [Termitomyces sp. T159_Od127]|nr:hypothetical protein C0993_000974 [Termitomyces sp. T159_Od127]
MYDGDRTSGERFLQSCLTYIHLSGDAFDSDVLKIAWVLSYMKARWAFTYALHGLQRLGGFGSFTDWAAFKKDFWAEFFPIDPAKSTALALHNREQYGQGKQTLDKYIDSFWALVEQAAYPDGLQLCLTFRNGLHPALMERIDNLAEGCSDDEQIASWYKVAQDQWQLMEIQQELQQAHPAPRSTSMVTFWHSALLHSGPAPAPATSAPRPLPPGIPMDVDVAQQHHSTPLLCWRCKKPGHFAWHCPLGLEMLYLSTVEQAELLLQLLAAKDAARAPSPDELAPELAQEESGAYAPLPGLEEDF